MKKIIYNLRQQPEEVRTQILHILTAVLGFILFVLWVYSLGVNINNEDTQTSIQNDFEPLSNLKSNLVDTYNNGIPESPVILGE